MTQKRVRGTTLTIEEDDHMLRIRDNVSEGNLLVSLSHYAGDELDGLIVALLEIQERRRKNTPLLG